MTIRVRPAAASDAAGIAAVHARSWKKAYHDLISDDILSRLSIPDRERMWHAILTKDDRHAHTVVAEAGDGSIAGFCSTIAPTHDPDVPDRTAEIAALYVDPDHWRAGVGRTLLTKTLDRLQAERWDIAILWVLAGNAGALRFYAAADFHPDDAMKTGPVGSAECVHGVAQLRLRRGLRARAAAT